MSSAEVTQLQEKILKLAQERLLENEDLSFGEILIVLCGCRPERIGSQKVRHLSRIEILRVCRLPPGEPFYFSDEAEQAKYHSARASASEAVAGLTKNGLLIPIREEKLIWAKGKPRVERIEYCEIFRLTEEGKKALTDKRRHRRHPLHAPVEYNRADSKKSPPAFTLNISEKGLLLDLGDKFEVGQNLQLRILDPSQEPIEMFARVVWVKSPSRKAERYRSGMKLVKISSENQNRLKDFLANASA
jgi:hypothetical protein